MVFVYKCGGDWELSGVPYTVDFVGISESKKMLKNGWHLSLDEALAVTEKSHMADADGDGKLSHEEAKAYLAEAGVEYEDGLHWKKVVAMAEQHMKGE
jgi:hypothetical protein